MKLSTLIEQYISYRKALGAKFATAGGRLRAFYKAMGSSASVNSVSTDDIQRFLRANFSIITASWFERHSALLGFYKYALARRYIKNNPMPQLMPNRPAPFIPYIYSNDELKRIFAASLTYQKNKSCISPHMIRTILIVTYALGLRIGETLHLLIRDLDLRGKIIQIRESKFFKSRIVPFNDQVCDILKGYMRWLSSRKHPLHNDSPLFFGKNIDRCFSVDSMDAIFRKICSMAQVRRDNNQRYQARIHDLRHVFAINRVTLWYRENKDVNKLLPILSVYMGHRKLSYTTIYLTLTLELLQQANMRFEKYAIGTKYEN